MNPFVRASVWIYAGIMLLYPWELRVDYGEAMVDLFAEDLANAWLKRSAADVIRIWWHAAAEALWIAPRRPWSELRAGPLVSLVLHVAVPAAIFAIGRIFYEGVPHGILHGLVSLNLRPPQ